MEDGGEFRLGVADVLLVAGRVGEGIAAADADLAGVDSDADATGAATTEVGDGIAGHTARGSAEVADAKAFGMHAGTNDLVGVGVEHRRRTRGQHPPGTAESVVARTFTRAP